MKMTLEILAIVLIASVALGIYRTERGPTAADRMLSSMLFGTSGTALTLLLAEIEGIHSLYDMALVFSLLGALASVAFVKRAWGPDE